MIATLTGEPAGTSPALVPAAATGRQAAQHGSRCNPAPRRPRRPAVPPADVCWDKCISSPGSYLSGRENSCIENCAKRFIDATQYILQRAAHKAQDPSGGF
jgi:hypothetical protein